MKTLACALLAACFTLLAGLPAGAQTIGTFRWQLEPYCNTLTLTVIQDAGGYRVRGTEDLCDPIYVTQPVHGIAVIDSEGQAVLNLTTGFPGGFTAQGSRVSGRLSPTTLSGFWSDDVGRSGVLTPTAAPSTPGLQRGGFPMSFVHEVSSATRPSVSSNVSCFSHPLTDGNAGALIQVTQNRGRQTDIATLVSSAVSVYYDDDGTGLPPPLDNNVWCVSRNDSVSMPNTARFTISVMTR